jgi:CheY-like chemotaxis protein
LTSGQITQIITAIAQLIGVLVWPAALVFLFVFFRTAIRSFISSLGEFSIRRPGMEVTAKRQAEAAAAIGAAEAARSPADGLPKESIDPRGIAEAVLSGARNQRRIQRSRVLWVDDRPNNNVLERQAFEALGVAIDLSTATSDAIDRTHQRSYELIISDMSRPPDLRAGYTLLDLLRAEGNATPFIVYAGSKSAEHVKEAREHGAIGTTNDPKELFRMAMQVLGG